MKMENSSIITFAISFIDYSNRAKDFNTIFSFLPFKPQKVWNKGDQIVFAGEKNKGYYNNSTWEYAETFAFTQDVFFEDILEHFLNQFLPYIDVLLDIKDDEINFELSVFYSEEDSHSGFSFNQKIITLLIDLQMELSIYPRSRKLFKLPPSNR